MVGRSLPVVRPRCSEPFLRAPGGVTTPVGTIDAGVLALVDAAGAVEPVGTTWTLDWWIGAEDRWHHPSVEAAVRQRSLGDAPLVHTAVRVPGGDVVARTGGVVATSGTEVGPGVLVEFENLSAVPVALALVLRPVRSDGGGRVVAARVHGSTVEIDGAVALRVDRPIARAVVGRCVADPPGGSVATRLAGADDRTPPLATEDRDGRAEVAVVVPLAHAATVRVLVGAGPGGEGPWSSPSLDDVTAGWDTHLDRLASLDLGDPARTSAFRAACATLLLCAQDVVADTLRRRRRGDGTSDSVRAALVCEAAARTGAVDLLPPVARALALAQRLGGACRLGDGTDGSVALLWAVAGVLGGPTAHQHADELVAPAAVAIRRLARRPSAVAEVGAAAAAAALRAVAPGLVTVGQPEVAADAVTVAGTVAGTGSTSRSGPQVLGGDATPVAEFVVEVLRSTVVDSADGLSVLPVVPESTRGLPLDVRDVRSAWGLVSWSLRWHGERPALLWEVEPAPGLGVEPAPTLRAPVLDPDWTGTGWSGEALLGATGTGPVVRSTAGDDPSAGSFS